jgi:hypothetical protein
MSNALKPSKPQQALLNPVARSKLDETKTKVKALENMANDASDEVQLDLVRSLVSNQLVHVTDQIEQTAVSLRSFDIGRDGEKARAEYQALLADQVTLCDDIVESLAHVTDRIAECFEQ